MQQKAKKVTTEGNVWDYQPNQLFFEIEIDNGDVLYLEDMSSTIVRRKISLQMLGVKPTPAAHAILTQLIQ